MKKNKKARSGEEAPRNIGNGSGEGEDRRRCGRFDAIGDEREFLVRVEYSHQTEFCVTGRSFSEALEQARKGARREEVEPEILEIEDLGAAGGGSACPG